MSEISVAEKVLAGDERVIGELVARAWPRFGMGAGGLTGEEMRQEACAELVEAARAHDGARDGDFAALAVARARRRMARVLRAERRRRSRLTPLAPDGGPDGRATVPGERFGSGWANPRLDRALARLSPRLRAIVALSFGEDASDADIGRRLRASAGAIGRARRRAEAALRADLLRPRRSGPTGRGDPVP